MTASSHAGSVFPGQQTRHDSPTRPESEYLRIARALLGVTPAQLAAHIGLVGAAAARREKVTCETHTLDHLSDALRAVIGWYDEALGNASAENGGFCQTPATLQSTIQRYLVLRSNWEHREACAIAARMSIPAKETTTKRASTVAAPAAGEADGRPFRVLLVDDTADVVVTVAAFLRTFGFDVIRASSGDAALAMLAGGEKIDLLVSDYAMPGLNGLDLIHQATQQRPELRALIITGYPDTRELMLLPANIMLLPKPFRRLELAERIHALLARDNLSATPATPAESLQGC